MTLDSLASGVVWATASGSVTISPGVLKFKSNVNSRLAQVLTVAIPEVEGVDICGRAISDYVNAELPCGRTTHVELLGSPTSTTTNAVIGPVTVTAAVPVTMYITRPWGDQYQGNWSGTNYHHASGFPNVQVNASGFLVGGTVRATRPAGLVSEVGGSGSLSYWTTSDRSGITVVGRPQSTLTLSGPELESEPVARPAVAVPAPAAVAGGSAPADGQIEDDGLIDLLINPIRPYLVVPAVGLGLITTRFQVSRWRERLGRNSPVVVGLTAMLVYSIAALLGALPMGIYIIGLLTTIVGVVALRQLGGR